jgi:hypothetical protein
MRRAAAPYRATPADRGCADWLRPGGLVLLAAASLLAGCAAVAPGGVAAPASAASVPAQAAASAPMAAAAPKSAASAPAASAPAARPPGAAPGPAGAASAPAGGAAPAAASGAAPTPPGGLRPFADVIKDAKRLDGPFAVYQKDDKVWLELRPQDLGQPFIVSPKIKTGIGEGGLYGGLMQGEVVVEFRRVHNQMQLLARNTDFVARPGTPAARAVEVGFSPSLLGSVPVLSQPHPERQSVLIEANGLVLSDLLGLGMQLQRRYRQGYAFDARNSSISAVRSTPEVTVLEVTSHFYTASIAIPQPAPPGSPPVTGPQPTTPRSLPDPRSLFITLHYSIARLPAQPMAARRADPRIGYFTANVDDFTDDLARTPRVRHIQRWRLEKQDPAAELSEPVKPITFWIDRSVPEKYRASVIAGVLEWNKAFERIGFRNALRAEIQPDAAEWDTLDFGRASIRWITSSSPSFGGIGPRHVDPRSGEILDADIALESLSSRSVRTLRASVLGAPTLRPPGADAAVPAELAARGLRPSEACEYADAAAEQLSYALEVLEAQGLFDPDSPQAEQFVQAYVKDVTMHEVGHTLGLRHNFRASRIWTEAQLADPEFVARNGLTGSVMEYSAINLPAPGLAARLGERAWTGAFTPTLGPYDYWAIEYGYRPFAPDAEREALGRIAARSAEPQLAYGTDEDQFLGIDPETLHFDLGNDAIAFSRKRIEIARDLIARQETRALRPDQEYTLLRRSVGFALRDMSRAAQILTRQIGGVRTLRDFPGSGRDPLTPVPAPKQREALALLASGFLSADSLPISPELQRKLVIDFNDRTDAVFEGGTVAPTDFSLAAQVLDLQRGVLNALMSDTMATRILDSETKSTGEAFRFTELLEGLQRAIWSEVGGTRAIPALRRELQREYVNRLALLLIRPNALSRADARSPVRTEALALLSRLETAARRGGLEPKSRAHLKDSADTLRQALEARFQRAGT